MQLIQTKKNKQSQNNRQNDDNESIESQSSVQSNIEKQYFNNLEEKFIKIIHFDQKLMIPLLQTSKQQIYDKKPHQKMFIKLMSHEQGKVEMIAPNQKLSKEWQKKIDQLLDDINYIPIKKHNLQWLIRMMKSKILKQSLKKQKIVLFQVNKNQFYIGGKSTYDHLYSTIGKIKRKQFREISLKLFKNTRSYSIFLNWACKKIKKVNNIDQIEFINYQKKSRCQKQDRNYYKLQYAKILITADMNTLDINSPDLEKYITQEIKSKYYYFVLVLQHRAQCKIYNKKNSNENFKLKLVDEKHFDRGYLYIMCKKQQLLTSLSEIKEKIQNLKLNVIGIRYFKGFDPILTNQLEQIYHVERYPSNYPYSKIIFNKQKSSTFNWIDIFKNL